ncbi:hypothetical protein Esti_005003 [Eimeria stiedai]
MPSSAQVGMLEELAYVLAHLAQDARLRVAKYLLHSTAFIDSIEPPYDSARIAIKLHSMLLTGGPPQQPLLVLLDKVLAATPRHPSHVLQDPELWGHLTLGLSTALVTAEHKATLIVQAFLRILEDTEGAACGALINACLQNIVVSLEPLTPSHSSSASLLQALSRCISFPGVLSEVSGSHTIQIQLGQAFQAIFASHETAPGVQELAIQLVERLFPALPEKQKTVFLDELCIVDWLLEVVRNGTPVAHSAFNCLQKHFFNSSCFLQHHFESARCCALPGSGSSRRGFPDWRPDLGKVAMVIEVAVTSICQQQQEGCVNVGAAGVADLLKRLEAGQQKSVKLDATSEPEGTCGLLALAARTIHAAQLDGFQLAAVCSIISMKSASSFFFCWKVRGLVSRSVKLNDTEYAQDAWPASLVDQAEFLSVVFATVPGSFGYPGSPNLLLDEAIEFVKNTSRSLLTHALRSAGEAQEPNVQRLSFPTFVVYLLLRGHSTPNNWKAMQREITRGFLDLLEMDTQLLPDIVCELDDDVRFCFLLERLSFYRLNLGRDHQCLHHLCCPHLPDPRWSVKAAPSCWSHAANPLPYNRLSVVPGFLSAWQGSFSETKKGRALPGLTAYASQLVQFDMLLFTENASPILAHDGFRSFPLRPKTTLLLLERCLREAHAALESKCPKATNLIVAFQVRILSSEAPLQFAHHFADHFALPPEPHFLRGGHASQDCIIQFLRSSTAITAILRRSMKNLKEGDDTFSKDAALALAVAGLLVIHLTVSPFTFEPSPVSCANGCDNLAIKPEREELPQPLLSFIRDPWGGESRPGSGQKAKMESYISLLTHPHEHLRAASSLLVAALSCFQGPGWRQVDTQSEAISWLIPASQTCSETTTDAAVLCLCALFTCGSIDSLLRSCLLNTTFSLVPFCNKCIRLASGQQDMLFKNLRRCSRSLFSIIVRRSYPHAIKTQVACTACACSCLKSAPHGSKKSPLAVLRLQDMQREREKPVDGKVPTGRECRLAKKSCQPFDAACVTCHVGSHESRKAAGQLAFREISERLLNVILDLVDEPRTYATVGSFHARQRE